MKRIGERPDRKDSEMRKLIVQTFLTLDGVMQAPGRPEEDASGGFTYGGWLVNYWNEQADQVMGEATSKPFAMVLGTSDLRHHGRVLARRPRGGGRPDLQRSNQIRRVAQSAHARMEQLGSDRGGSRRWPRCPQGAGRAGAGDLWQRESDPDFVALTTSSTSSAFGSLRSSSDRESASSPKAPSPPGWSWSMARHPTPES